MTINYFIYCINWEINMQTVIKNIMLAIAELQGYKVGTVEGKLQCGINAYITSKLHHLDSNDESDRSEIYENIWLERLYLDLDAAYGIDSDPLARTLAVDVGTVPVDYKWSVPIELDANASMLSYMGALLGDERLLTMTNSLVVGNKLNDAWSTVAGVPRGAVKVPYVPDLYGSMQTERTLLERSKKFSKEQIEEWIPLLKAEKTNGAFGLASMFKDFIIKHVKTKEVMDVVIGDDSFEITCNKWKDLGDHREWYIFPTATGEKMVPHYVTKRVPDLVAFKRYFVTLLIHNLDSQVANTVAAKVYDKYQWIIPIHDAFIVPPQAAEDVRYWYAEEITKIYRNRKSILANYFSSIGIDGSAQADWEALVAKVVPVEEDFTCSKYVLK